MATQLNIEANQQAAQERLSTPEGKKDFRRAIFLVGWAQPWNMQTLLSMV